MPAPGSTTKSAERREAIIAAAIASFAGKGFYGTTTAEIAQAVGISQPYVFRLFPSKEALFAAAVDRVSVIMTDTVLTHGRHAAGDDALASARAAYGDLVTDPVILRFLMHANCATAEPLVADAVRRCYAKQVETMRGLLGGDAEAVRQWFRAGMLDNVVAVLGIAESDEAWARTLSGR